MNNSMKKLAMMSLPLLLAGMGNDMNDLPRQVKIVKLDWERKKCKSCKSFPCNDNRHKWRSNPLSQACEKYDKRKKK